MTKKAADCSGVPTDSEFKSMNSYYYTLLELQELQFKVKAT